MNKKDIYKLEELIASERKIGFIDGILVILSFLILISVIFLLYTLFSDYYGNEELSSKIEDKQTNYSHCKNESLQLTALCLRDFVKSNFNYIIIDDKLNLTIAEIIKYGGDCKNWNEDFYMKIMQDWGFGTVKIKLPIKYIDNKNYVHLVVMAYDKNGYCLLDQTDVECYKYEN